METWDGISEEKYLEVVDLSEKFLSMVAVLFDDELRVYRKQPIHLKISVPWKGDYLLGIRLKAFVEGKTGDQKRTAIIKRTSEQHEEALELLEMPNVLSSGVKWEFTA